MSNIKHRLFLLGALSLPLTTSASALPQAGSGCTPGWGDAFGAAPGVDGILPPDAFAQVHVFRVFDDGNGGGPALYAGGQFTLAGGTPATGIARWDGQHWSSLGPDSELPGILALEVFDDGSGAGEELYAGGEFKTAYGAPADHVARWDGAAWQPLGSGFDGRVRALKVFDDGSGPALYAGGHFQNAGGVPASSIAKWDGTAWTPLAGGTNGYVWSLEVFDDGSGAGPELYVGGYFTTADTLPAKGVAKWDGSSWSSVGGGLFWGQVFAMTVFDDGQGGGPGLYVGGQFSLVGGVTARRVARWDGSGWSALGLGMDLAVHSLASLDDGSGPVLYAGGEFTTAGDVQAKALARWDGLDWSTVGEGVSGQVYALASFQGVYGESPRMYVGGEFGRTGDRVARSIASWDGAELSPLTFGADGDVLALKVVHAAGGQEMYAAGSFSSIDGVSAVGVAEWDGVTWSPLGLGISGFLKYVQALEVYDDGSGGGPQLYAAGNFGNAGGVTAHNIARWDGTDWWALGSGTNHIVEDLEVFDDGAGGGSQLYVAGFFSDAGGVPNQGLARWNGSAWSTVPGVFNSFGIASLEVYDDGSGPALFVGGNFITAGGVPARHVAKWDGTTWSGLGQGLPSRPLDLIEFDDGSGGGMQLYAGGKFTNSSGDLIHPIERWDGTSWLPVGPVIHGIVEALDVYDDGSGNGRALYVGGELALVANGSAEQLLRWDGASWSALGSEMFGGGVSALAVYGGEPAGLYAGGVFNTSAAGDGYLARYGQCTGMAPIAFCFGDGSGVACPCANDGVPGQGCTNSTGSGATLAAMGSPSIATDSLTFVSTHLPSVQPALLFAGENALANGDGQPFGDGLRCTGGGVLRLGVQASDAAGNAGWGPGLAASANWQPGDTRRFQVWYRDSVGGPCGFGFNLSPGVEVSFGE